MKITLLLIALCTASSLLAVDATVDGLKATPVTLLWSNDTFEITSGTNKEIIPIEAVSGVISPRKSSVPSIPGVRGLYFQHQVSIKGGKEEDTSYFAFRDLDGNEICLRKDKAISLLRLEMSILIDGRKSQVVLWKQQK